MKCNNCGNEILENSKFCPNCGTPVSVVQNNEEPVQSISNENSQNLSNNNENSIENIETVESSAFVSSNNDIPNTNLEQAVDNNINNQTEVQLQTNDSVINNGLNQSVEEPITSNTEINSIQPNTNQVNEQPIVYEQPSTNIVNNNKEKNSTNIISDNNASISSNKKEKTIGYAILGFLFPLVGLIVFFVIRKNKPKSAKASLIGAIISFVLSIIISVILTVLSPVTTCIACGVSGVASPSCVALPCSSKFFNGKLLLSFTFITSPVTVLVGCAFRSCSYSAFNSAMPTIFTALFVTSSGAPSTCTSSIMFTSAPFSIPLTAIVLPKILMLLPAVSLSCLFWFSKYP